MSDKHVEIAHAVVDAVATQDLARLLELTDPEVEWHSLTANLGAEGVYRGHEGIRRYVADIAETWEFLIASVDDALQLTDALLMIGRLRYRGKGSGVESDSQVGYLLRFRGGRVLEMRAFRDPERAITAIGLPEQHR